MLFLKNFFLQTFFLQKNLVLPKKKLIFTKEPIFFKKHRSLVPFIGVSLLLLLGTNKIHNIMFKYVNI